ncbi:hypothetical protein, partial [Carboxydocella sp. JDF658]
PRGGKSSIRKGGEILVWGPTWLEIKTVKFFEPGRNMFNETPVSEKALAYLKKYGLWGLIGLGLLVYGLLPGGGQNQEVPVSAPATSQRDSDIASAERELETKATDILRQVAGAGEIKVRVVLKATENRNFAVNSNITRRTTQEKDERGGNRTITEVTEQNQLVLTRNGSQEVPVMVQAVRPPIEGVVVAATGARDPVIKAQLANTVATLFHIPVHRVTVIAAQ